MCAARTGSETEGSITCPAGVAALLGVKPTLGLVSRSGIVPLAHSQDTAGPMARTVADAAVVLAAMAGGDPADPATVETSAHSHGDYTRSLDASGLKGARIGVARNKVTSYSPPTDRLFEGAIEDLRRLGAEIVGLADLGSLGECDDTELEVLHYGFKAEVNEYLAARTGVPIRSLRRLQNTGRWPENGLQRMICSAIIDSPSNERRMSQGTVHRYTLMAAGKLDIPGAPRPPAPPATFPHPRPC